MKEAHITVFAEARWISTTVDQDKHTVGKPTYQARQLAIVIMNSITDDFMTTLIHQVPTKLRNAFNNDVNKYIIFVKDNLKMITTTTTSEHNGLIT
jgi:hypothetical protein